MASPRMPALSCCWRHEPKQSRQDVLHARMASSGTKEHLHHIKSQQRHNHQLDNGHQQCSSSSLLQRSPSPFSLYICFQGHHGMHSKCQCDIQEHTQVTSSQLLLLLLLCASEPGWSYNRLTACAQADVTAMRCTAAANPGSHTLITTASSRPVATKPRPATASSSHTNCPGLLVCITERPLHAFVACSPQQCTNGHGSWTLRRFWKQKSQLLYLVHRKQSCLLGSSLLNLTPIRCLKTYQEVEGYIECTTEQQHAQGVQRVAPVPKVDEYYHSKQMTRRL
jgi:hypothetical protein